MLTWSNASNLQTTCCVLRPTQPPMLSGMKRDEGPVRLTFVKCEFLFQSASAVHIIIEDSQNVWTSVANPPIVFTLDFNELSLKVVN